MNIDDAREAQRVTTRAQAQVALELAMIQWNGTGDGANIIFDQILPDLRKYLLTDVEGRIELLNVCTAGDCAYHRGVRDALAVVRGVR